jgi:hypothetical protein
MDTNLFERLTTIPESLAGTIIRDLARCCEHPEASPVEADRRKTKIIALMTGIRASHCGRGLDAYMGLSAHEFREHAKRLSQAEQDIATAAYELLWSHQSIEKLINTERLHQHDYPELVASRLEDAARIYLEETWMHSPALEWLFIDALVFAETVSFARATYPTEDSGPQPVPTVWTRVRSAAPWARILKEIVFLWVTVLGAAILDPSKGLGFWAIFAVATLIRWLKPPGQVIEPFAGPTPRDFRVLCNSMCAVHDRLRDQAFNARLFRDLLYWLERQGAQFSPTIYHLLDRRIARTAAIHRLQSPHDALAILQN